MGSEDRRRSSLVHGINELGDLDVEMKDILLLYQRMLNDFLIFDRYGARPFAGMKLDLGRLVFDPNFVLEGLFEYSPESFLSLVAFPRRDVPAHIFEVAGGDVGNHGLCFKASVVGWAKKNQPVDPACEGEPQKE